METSDEELPFNTVLRVGIKNASQTLVYNWHKKSTNGWSGIPTGDAHGRPGKKSSDWRRHFAVIEVGYMSGISRYFQWPFWLKFNQNFLCVCETTCEIFFT